MSAAHRSTERVCFLLRVRPERLDEYRARHGEVWPQMRDALSAAGWRNYSLFLTDDGLLVGYFECDDYAAAQAAIQVTDVNARWQAEMEPFFATDPADPSAKVSEGRLRRVEEVFHLA